MRAIELINALWDAVGPDSNPEVKILTFSAHPYCPTKTNVMAVTGDENEIHLCDQKVGK
jgi:hypothetical protein